MEKVRQMLKDWKISDEQTEQKCEEAERIINCFHMTEEQFVGYVKRYKKTHAKVTQLMLVQQEIEEFANL